MNSVPGAYKLYVGKLSIVMFFVDAKPGVWKLSTVAASL